MPDLNIPHGSMPAELRDHLAGAMEVVNHAENALKFEGDMEVYCDPASSIELHQVVWEDLRVPVTSGRTGASNPATLTKYLDNGAGSFGVFAYAFADQGLVGNEEQIWFAVQMPHSYKLGTDIYPHLHWGILTGGTAGQFVKWGFEYTWQTIGGVFSNTTVLTTDASSAATATTQGDTTLIVKKHYLSLFSAIDGSGINSVSSMLLCRLFRNSSHADDDLAQAAFAFEIDFHYQRDTMGSRQQYVK